MRMDRQERIEIMEGLSRRGYSLELGFEAEKEFADKEGRQKSGMCKSVVVKGCGLLDEQW